MILCMESKVFIIIANMSYNNFALPMKTLLKYYYYYYYCCKGYQILMYTVYYKAFKISLIGRCIIYKHTFLNYFNFLNIYLNSRLKIHQNIIYKSIHNSSYCIIFFTSTYFRYAHRYIYNSTIYNNLGPSIF